MKYILEFILSTIIIFFVWNTLKRIFFTKFYQFPPKNKNQEKSQNSSPKNENKINWDAETVDYEEVDKK